ncbi:MAG: ABC-type transport auxiliary lipoprotein family protein, partial [Burkholderiales bacterium]|nr:ABC-type transport auxiliary lipoprotein family protein [Burkholderiales bacterium]
YRESAQRFVKDPYREWLSPPAQLLTLSAQQWLQASGLFSEVLSLSSKQTADYQLSGELLTLHTDLQSHPLAVAKLHIRLSSATSPVILETILTASEPLNGTQAADIAAGLDRALASTLKQLESKLISLPNH